MQHLSTRTALTGHPQDTAPAARARRHAPGASSPATARSDAIASPTSIAALSDGELFTRVRALVGRSNRTLAALLEHLAEVEARGLHRARACATLTSCCVYELRMSEDAASQRARAARAVREFPALLGAVARGELHLTGLVLLAPHLIAANLPEVLARARFRTKREIERLVAFLAPKADVPALIEPLAPERHEPRLGGPSHWQRFMEGLPGPVRQLPAWQRPASWGEGESDGDGDGDGDEHADDRADDARAAPRLGALRHRVQFTASQEYVTLLEEARDLLAHAVPDRSIAEVHLRAMRELVVRLRERRTGTDAAGAAPRAPASPDAPRRNGSNTTSPDAPRRNGCDTATPDVPRRNGSTTANPDLPRRNGMVTASPDAPRRNGSAPAESPGVRRRAVPAAVRGAVWLRDGRRCAFVDEGGRRCRETAWLELHHRTPHARGGTDTADNLSLRCRSHNAHEAERDFGREWMAAKRER